jgi:hypothetical protein
MNKDRTTVHRCEMAEIRRGRPDARRGGATTWSRPRDNAGRAPGKPWTRQFV